MTRAHAKPLHSRQHVSHVLNSTYRIPIPADHQCQTCLPASREVLRPLPQCGVGLTHPPPGCASCACAYVSVPEASPPLDLLVRDSTTLSSVQSTTVGISHQHHLDSRTSRWQAIDLSLYRNCARPSGLYAVGLAQRRVCANMDHDEICFPSDALKRHARPALRPKRRPFDPTASRPCRKTAGRLDLTGLCEWSSILLTRLCRLHGKQAGLRTYACHVKLVCLLFGSSLDMIPVSVRSDVDDMSTVRGSSLSRVDFCSC
nr:hypothetical protein CFP56_12198 [Quercus suber]